MSIHFLPLPNARKTAVQSIAARKTAQLAEEIHAKRQANEPANDDAPDPPWWNKNKD